MGEKSFVTEAGVIVWVVDGRNAENDIRTEDASQREAWQSAPTSAAGAARTNAPCVSAKSRFLPRIDTTSQMPGPIAKPIRYSTRPSRLFS